MSTKEVFDQLVESRKGWQEPIDHETSAQAAKRHGISQHTLYRRLARAVERGEVTLTTQSYVSGSLFLPVRLWDELCQSTRPPGRPKRG
jgi:hypothetical protein